MLSKVGSLLSQMQSSLLCVRALRIFVLIGLLFTMPGGPDWLLAGPAPITVTVSPGTVNLLPGAGQQFTVAVTGTTKTAVTWSCTADGGMVDSTGFYTA